MRAEGASNVSLATDRMMSFCRPSSGRALAAAAPRRVRRLLAVLLCAAAAWLALASAPASAVLIHPLQTQFFATDSPAGSFNFADKVGIDQVTGNVYVIDHNHNVVDKFDSAGVYQSQLTFGGFGGDPDVAVDNSGGASQGHVYVLPEGGPLSGFDSSGTALGGNFPLNGSNTPDHSFGDPCGTAVDSSGNIYVSEFNDQAIDKFDSAGNYITRFPVSFGPCDVAVDTDGTIYVVHWNNAVHKLSSSGADQGVIDSNNPSAVSVDPVDHHVYVVRRLSGAGTPSTVAEYDSSGNLVSEFGSGRLFNSRGVDVKGSTHKAYVSSNPPSPDASRVAIFGPLATLPDVTTGDVSDLLGTSATLNGTVNPDGIAASYQFEYGTTTAYGSTVPASPESVGSDSSDHAVSEPVSGLTPGTVYHYRLDGINVNGTNFGDDRTFTTPIAPTIDSTSVASVGVTGAVVKAQIKPGFGPHTLYHFDYGTTMSYGSSTPDADIGDGNVDKTATGQLSGLAPNTTYHFRVVAQNAVATVPGPDMTFTTYPPNGPFTLPDNRAFEQVSPQDKNGGDILNGATVAAMSGNAVTFQSFEGFAGAQGGALLSEYLASRGSGWSTHGISPLQNAGLLSTSAYQDFSSDLSQGIVCNADPPLDGATPGSTNLYRRDSSGAYHLLSPGEPAGGGCLLGGGPTYDGASSDLSHVVFEQHAALTSDAVPGVNNLYEFSDGQLHLASIDPGGTPDPNGGSTDAVRTAVSDDGARIFWSNGADGEIYMRQDLSSTTQVSASARTPVDPDGPRPKTIWTATPDGSSAFFTSSEKLTDDSTASGTAGTSDLYRYDAGTGALTDLTVDPGDPNGADVRAVLGSSADGSVVYFVARGVLASGATAGDMNLYVRSGATTTFITALANFGDSTNWDQSETTKTSRVTPDGRFLLFSSVAPQLDYDNAGHLELYRYDAQADHMGCASCNPTNVPATGDVKLTTSLLPLLTLTPVNNLADDGSVFFMSPEQLVGGDTNHAYDVYEWKGDHPQLISSGQSSQDSEFAGAGPSGHDVFILTRARLLASDQDDEIDMYDARVDGGFPSPPQTSPCAGDACRGPLTAPPLPATPLSTLFSGPGNVTPTSVKFSLGTISRAARNRFARTGRLTLSVKVTGAAHVTAKATAKIGRRTRTVASRSATASGARTLHLTLTLSRAARSQLGEKHKLKLTIAVSVSGVGTRRTTMTLRK